MASRRATRQAPTPLSVAEQWLERGGEAFAAERFVESAAAYARAAEQLRPRMKAGADPDVVALWVRATTGQAGATRARGAYDRADRLLDAADAAVRKHLPKGHPALADVLNERGILRKYQGRFALSEAQYRRARPLVARAFGERSHEMSVLLHNLGGIAHARGHHARAEAFARRGLALRLALEGGGTVAVAADRTALAAILDARGKSAEAARLLAAALATFRRRLGPRSFEVGATLETLGNLRYREGALAEADRLLSNALEVQEERLGRGHPELAFALHNLGVVRAERGRAAEGRKLLERSLATFEKTLGPRHPNTSAVRARLASLAPAASKGPTRETARRRSRAGRARA